MTHLKLLYSNMILFISVIPIAFAYIIRSPWKPTNREAKISRGYLEDSLMNFTELTAKYGYSSVQHKVVTDDEYILTMFRIVKAKNCVGKIKSPPVLLMHGLLLSSDAWIDSGPDSGLAYLIADACYDLWVGNSRGNYYSRQHVRLDPDNDHKYWNFYINEIGTYDIPAMIDYVLDNTGSKKLNYIGFSQGAGTFLIMCSERAGYCDKVQLMIGMSPATRHRNAKSIIFRGLTQVFEKSESILNRYGVHEILSKGSFYQDFLEYFCQTIDQSKKVCDISLAIFDHVDSLHLGSISNVTTQTLFGHFPAGTSLHNMARYGQSMRSKRFEKFDYGKKKNLIMYGSEHTPIYNLSAVTVPVVCIYGRNDGIVDSADVKWLASQLPNVIELFEVKNPLWTHLDMTYSKSTKKAIFPKISDYLTKFSHN